MVCERGRSCTFAFLEDFEKIFLLQRLLEVLERRSGRVLVNVAMDVWFGGICKLSKDPSDSEDEGV